MEWLCPYYSCVSACHDIRLIMMKEPEEFSFGDNSVAKAYDDILVPILFEPWADRLIEEFQPWEGRRVLDLATGTGIVAQRLSEQVGRNGKVLAADINSEMLEIATQRCAGKPSTVEFVETPAYPLDVESSSIDFVVCQQGFQFFPDKGAAVGEIFRVLRDGGKIVVTTWCSVGECQFFGSICTALDAIGMQDISNMMKIPFDFMPASELLTHFETSGFQNVKVCQLEDGLVIEGGVGKAIEVAFATPIGPKLRMLSDRHQDQFKSTFSNLIKELGSDGVTMGRMVSNLLSAEKPA